MTANRGHMTYKRERTPPEQTPEFRERYFPGMSEEDLHARAAILQNKDKPNMNKPITFHALVHQLRTLPDGGWRITFDLGDNEREAVMALSEHRTGQVGVAVVPVGVEAPQAPDEVSWEEDLT
jgi:hypothetical protein